MTDAERALVLQLDRDGLTQVQIAQRLNRNQSTISDWLAHCTDSTDQAKRYLRGQALTMAQNIVKRGKARDHVVALKGLNVLEEQQSGNVTVIVGGSGMVNVGIGLSPRPPLVVSESAQIP
jgi:IS30 family transposase